MSTCNIGLYTHPDSLYVGIGTTAPNYTLDISGNVNITGSMKVPNMNMFRNKIINGDMRLDTRNTGGIAGISGSSAMKSDTTDKWAIVNGQYSPTVVAQQVALNTTDQATTGQTYALSVSPANIPFGLSAYFPFEGTLKDASGNGVAVSPIGSMLYVPGRVGTNALYLANEANVLATSTKATNYVQYTMPSYTTLTLAGWIYFTKAPFTGQYSVSIHYGTSTTETAQVIARYVSTSQTSLYGTAAGIPESTGTTININTWYHVALVVTSTSLTLYINGTQAATVTGTQTATTPTTLTVGDSAVYVRPFAGYIDEVRFYNRVLTTTEISALAGLTPFQPILPATNTLTSYFPLDGNLNDTVAANNLTGTGTITYNGGIVGTQCAYFANEATAGTATASANYASGIIPTVGTSGPITMTVWMNTTKLSANASYSPTCIAIGTSSSSSYSLSIYNAGNTSVYGVAMYNGTTFYTSGSVSQSVINTISINTWYFMTLVWSSNTLSFYINGTFVTSVTTTGTLPANTRYLNLAGGATVNNSWAGYLDDIRVFNGTALTPSQIAAIYYSTNTAYANVQQQIDAGQLADFQWGTAAAMPVSLTAWLKNNTAVAQSFSLSLNSTGLIGYLPLDNSYADAAGAGFLSAPIALSSTAFSSSVFKVGTYSLNCSANTIGSTMVAGVYYSLPSYIPFPISISLWFNPTTVNGASTYQSILMIGNVVPYTIEILLNYPSGSLYAQTNVFSITNTVNSYPNVIPTAGAWNHAGLVIVNGYYNLYLNGVLVAQGTYSSSVTALTNVDRLYLGGRLGTTIPFKGYIDDVRIYNRALTDAQVLALYNANASSTTAPTSTAITLPVRNITYNTPSIPANSWQQIQLTIPADSTGSWETRPGQPAANLALCLGAGSAYSNVTTGAWTNNTEYIGGTTQLIQNSSNNFLTASSNAVLLTGVQLEKGALATGYEMRPFEIEGILTKQKLAFVIAPSTATNWAAQTQVKGFNTYIVDINCSTTNSYNITSGYFTCQIPGLYFFSVNLYGTGSGNYWIRKNASTYINGIELAGTVTNNTFEICTTVVSLDLNDTISIWVRAIGSGVIQTTYAPNTTFNGYLIM